MYCKYCGLLIDEDSVFCKRCGRPQNVEINQQQPDNNQLSVNKNNRKSMTIVLVCVVIVAVAVFIISSFFIYKAKREQSIRRDSRNEYDISSENSSENSGENSGDVSLGDIKTREESKVYKVIDDSISEKDMKDIVYYLQIRAEKITAEAEVLMKKMDYDWYIEISMPEASDEKYEQVIRNADLEFVIGYGTDEPEVVVTGKNVKSAKAEIKKDATTGISEVGVSIVFDEEGTELFADATTRCYENGYEPISIVLDGELISSPTVKSPITDGECWISGIPNYEEAESLATLISTQYDGFSLEEIN